MFFHVRDLEIRAGHFDVEIPAGQIDFQDPKLRQLTPLRARGKVQLMSDMLGEIRVSGHLAVLMEADCDRCLDPAQYPVNSDFSLEFRPSASDSYGDEKAIDPSESEMGFYEGDGLELNDVLREFVLLALPMQRLCKEDCKGMCPQCGQNRNQKECECQPLAADDRWAALKHIK